MCSSRGALVRGRALPRRSLLRAASSAAAAPRCFPAAVLEPRRAGTKPARPRRWLSRGRQCRRRSFAVLSAAVLEPRRDGTKPCARPRRWLLRGGSAAAALRCSLAAVLDPATRRHEAVRARSGGCCPEVVPWYTTIALVHCTSSAPPGCCAAAVLPPCLAASRQRCSGRGALARGRARPRRWPLRCSSAVVYYYSILCTVLVVHRLAAARRQCCRRTLLFSAAVLEPRRAGPEPCVPAAWLLRCSSVVVYYSSILCTVLY